MPRGLIQWAIVAVVAYLIWAHFLKKPTVKRS